MKTFGENEKGEATMQNTLGNSDETILTEEKEYDVGLSPVLNQEAIDKRYVYRGAKRVIDFIGGFVGLVVLSPVFLATAIAIKVNDPKGEIIYSQIRVGRNEKNFKIYKFRSMYADADERLEELLEQNEVEGPMFKMKSDPRITPVGKFIRKYSVDELPQLYNVLLGNMSLVGPRPPLPREVKEYTNYAKQRLLVKPGCTGWWQVNERNNTGFSGMLKRDIEYVQNQTMRLDIKILLMTVKVVLFPHDVY